MNKIGLFILLIIGSSLATAQKLKGDRLLAWNVDMAENNNYDSAYKYAQQACMQSIHLFFPWSSIEPTKGSFDANYIANTLDIVNIYHPAYGIKAELQIGPINTVTNEVPKDLKSTAMDNKIMIDRFKVFLDTLFKHIPKLELNSLNIGNESDIFLSTDKTKYEQYKIFLDSVIPYAKKLYFDIHNKPLKVGTTLTFNGLTKPKTSALCKILNKKLDIVTLTYYPLNSDYTMQNPSVVNADFAKLISLYSDVSQPIHFAECGFSSSKTCNSSELKQSDFYKNIFKAWDTYYKNIKYLTLFKTTDWSQKEVDGYAKYYGINDKKFLEYLRTLGVREWANNGKSKLAYETILCELEARKWCNVKCNISGLKKPITEKKSLIYPNPCHQYIIINSSKILEEVCIYNTSGTKVLKTNMKKINVSKLKNGIYYITIDYKKGDTIYNKLIKY